MKALTLVALTLIAADGLRISHAGTVICVSKEDFRSVIGNREEWDKQPQVFLQIAPDKVRARLNDFYGEFPLRFDLRLLNPEQLKATKNINNDVSLWKRQGAYRELITSKIPDTDYFIVASGVYQNSPPFILSQLPDSSISPPASADEFVIARCFSNSAQETICLRRLFVDAIQISYQFVVQNVRYVPAFDSLLTERILEYKANCQV